MMEFVVFGETLSTDQRSYEVIIDRILREKSNINDAIFHSLPNIRFHGKGDLIRQLPTALEFSLNRFSPDSYFVIVVDGDGKYPSATNTTRLLINNKIRKIKNKHFCKVMIGIPTYNIESWLLGDVANIMNITGLNNIDSYPKVETIKYSKEEFNHIYSQYRQKLATEGNISLQRPDFVTKLFETINIDTLCTNSVTFKKFVKDVCGVCI